ncbi:hypothetical protein H311_04613, partial [Anncaliia algerae PRA109]
QTYSYPTNPTYDRMVYYHRTDVNASLIKNGMHSQIHEPNQLHSTNNKQQNFSSSQNINPYNRINYQTYEYFSFLEYLKERNKLYNKRAYNAEFMFKQLKYYDNDAFSNAIKHAFREELMRSKVKNEKIKDSIVNLMLAYFKDHYYNAIVFFTFWSYFSCGFKNCYINKDEVLYVGIYNDISSGKLKKISFINLLQNWKFCFEFYNGYEIYLRLIELFIRVQKDSMVDKIRIVSRFRAFEIRAFYLLQHFLS